MPDDKTQTARPIRWEAFPNPGEGGWFSYVEDAKYYLGGALFETEAEAIADAKRIAKEAMKNVAA